MSGGIGEAALADMATTDFGTMVASNAAMSTIPTAIDAAGQLANPFLGSVMAGGAGSLPLELTGADQMLLKSGADALPGMLPGSPVASASQLASRGIGSLTNNVNLGSVTGSDLSAAYDPADAVNATSRELPASVQSQLAANAAAKPYALSAPGANTLSGINPAGSLTPGMGATAPADALTSVGGAQSGVGGLLKWVQANPAQAAAMGLGANYLFNKMATPNYLPGYTPPSAASYGLGRTLAAGYQPVRPMAGGGLTVGAGSVPTQGVAPSDLMQKPNQGAGLDSLAAQYGISPQMVSQARQTYGFSAGGPTEMAVGGKLLSGHGDGMSDSIKANISGSQEARLGDGEFVVPADVVSHLGNGSTDAGAKQLYSMMDKVRKARTGRKAQGRQINPQQYMPA